MKAKYIKPEINTEILIKDDLLQVSTEVENNYANSKRIILGDEGSFSVEDMDIL